MFLTKMFEQISDVEANPIVWRPERQCTFDEEYEEYEEQARTWEGLFPTGCAGSRCFSCSRSTLIGN